MPHSVHSRDLGRNRPWRKATVRSLAQALLKRERMQTTLAKAKEAQRLTERLITLGKEGSLSARRRAQSILNDPPGVRKLFAEIAPRFQNRSGGYTRILHYGNRHGDGAKMAWIELVELGIQIKEKSKPKTSVKGKPVSKEKPTKERPSPAPETSEKPPAVPEKKPAKPEQKKPDSFVDGLRKLFKRRNNP